MKRSQLLLAIFLILAMGLGSLGSSVSQVAAQTLPPPVKTAVCSIPEGERIHLVGRAGEAIPLHLEAISATAADCIWAAGKPAEFGSLELQETVNALEATYTPDPGHIGSDEFELLVAKPHGLPSQVTFQVDVMPSKPISMPDTESLAAGNAPRMEVYVTYNQIEGYDFPASSRVYLYVDGAYMDRRTSSSSGYVSFYLYNFDVKAGQTVILTSGSVSLSYKVQAITVDA